MEVENGYIWKVTTIGGDPFLTSMIMGGSVAQKFSHALFLFGWAAGPWVQGAFGEHQFQICWKTLGENPSK